MLGALEVSILTLSVYLGTFLSYLLSSLLEVHPLAPPTNAVIPWVQTLIFVLVLMLSLSAMGLYQSHKARGINSVLLRLVASYFVGVAILTLIFFIAPPLTLSRSSLFFSVVMSFLLLAITRLVFLRTAGEEIFKLRILVLGTGEQAARMINTLHRHSDRRSARILGFVNVGSEPSLLAAHQVVYLENSLAEFAQQHQVEEIVIALDDRRNNLPLSDLLQCRLRGIAVKDSTAFLERETGKLDLKFLSSSWMIYNEGFRQGALRRFTSRVVDVLASLILVVVTGPLMLITACAILLESGGPVIYRQVRVGLNDKQFTLYKFRSMVVNAEQDNKPSWAQQNDSRVTPSGQFIRKYRIDELPQLLNVLRGEMSIVGPRPERPEFVDQLEQEIPYYALRHTVKPGVTGWAQVNYPYGASTQDAYEKLQYDLYYVKNHSLFLDSIILLQTVEVILWGKGAR